MCNFFSRYRAPPILKTVFGFAELPNDPPRYVVRPTDTERVVAIGKDGGRHAVPMRWGLVPGGAKSVKTGLSLFNWRSEDAWDRPSFAEPLRRGRRCLVPCDGFFEFTGEKGQKQPYLFAPKHCGVMAFAGLWEMWRGSPGEPLSEPLLSFSIATCAPNATVAPYHDRMPVLLTDEAEWEAWLAPGATADDVRRLLAPAADDFLNVVPVTRELLKIKSPGADVLEPVPLAP